MSKGSLSLLAFGDLEAKKAAVQKFSKKDLCLYDLILFTGDIPNPEVFRKLSKKIVENGTIDLTNRLNIAEETEPKEALEQVKKEFNIMQGVFKEIQKNVRFIGVWGNADNTKILQKVPIERCIEIINNRAVRIGEFYLLGYSGRPIYIFEKENKEQWAFSEEKAFNDLEKSLKALKGKKVILVTHAPPYGILDQVEKNYRKYGMGTYGEKAKNGHIGSIAFKSIDEKYKPILHIFGHIHECKGAKRIDGTTFVNTGSFGKDLEYVEIKIEKDKVNTRFIKL